MRMRSSIHWRSSASVLIGLSRFGTLRASSKEAFRSYKIQGRLTPRGGLGKARWAPFLRDLIRFSDSSSENDAEVAGRWLELFPSDAQALALRTYGLSRQLRRDLSTSGRGRPIGSVWQEKWHHVVENLLAFGLPQEAHEYLEKVTSLWSVSPEAKALDIERASAQALRADGNRGEARNVLERELAADTQGPRSAGQICAIGA